MAYSFVQYLGDGVTTLFAVTFPYINIADISVKVAGVSVSFTWADSTHVSISPAPALAAVVEVRRNTTKTSLQTVFQDGSILGKTDLNNADNQLFYIAQEAFDATGGALALNSLNVFDAVSTRISNVANATQTNDAVNLSQLQAAQLVAGNVPTPANPGDTGKFLKANSGSFGWSALPTFGAAAGENLGGAIVDDGAGNLTIAPNSVTNAMAAQMSALTLKGNASGAVANAANLTVAQVTAMLGVVKTIRRTFVAASGTYNASAGTIFADVYMVGGGGGGGGAGGSSGATKCAGGGGGAGGYCYGFATAAQLAGGVAVVIGAGGAAGSTAGGNGGAGGNSTFGALFTANGGTGGTGDVGNSNAHTTPGGAGGTATGAAISLPGAPGAPGYGMTGSVAASDNATGGYGGSGAFGYGGVPAISVNGTAPAVAGNSGGGFGTGGSGAAGTVAGATTRAGGSGAQGIVIIVEYIAQ